MGVGILVAVVKASLLLQMCVGKLVAVIETSLLSQLCVYQYS